MELHISHRNNTIGATHSKYHNVKMHFDRHCPSFKIRPGADKAKFYLPSDIQSPNAMGTPRANVSTVAT
jgi:hypothetical protein